MKKVMLRFFLIYVFFSFKKRQETKTQEKTVNVERPSNKKAIANSNASRKEEEYDYNQRINRKKEVHSY